jgi:hypothetical protein
MMASTTRRLAAIWLLSHAEARHRRVSIFMNGRLRRSTDLIF